ELVVGQADAVIGEPVLREVVGADLLAAVAGAYLLLTVFGLQLMDALSFYFIKPGTENAHALLAVLDLRFLVLAAYDGVGRNVRDADGGVGRVDRLATGSGGAEGVDPKVLGFDLDVYFFGFRKHGYSDGRGV